MALSKYIKQPLANNLPQYVDAELRKVERSSSELSTNISDLIEELNMAEIEIGSFLPTLRGDTTPGVGTYTLQQGQYLKMGRIVIVQYRVATSAHSGTGQAILDNLPFNIKNITNGHFSGSVYSGNQAVAFCLGRPGTSFLAFYAANPAAGINIAANMEFLGSIIYLNS